MTTYRGHEIVAIGGGTGEQAVYAYADGELVSANVDRACGHCGRSKTAEGHDGCIGTLPGVMNACCGHGVVADAYVQFWNGKSLHGADAIASQKELLRAE